jgi:dipeptidyl aminopeptidase/acylaminoacyl peptidase
VSPELAQPTEGEALELVLDYPGAVVAFDQREDGAVATIGKVLDGAAHSYDQMDVLLASGAWPMRGPKRVNATRNHAFGETLGADQHPPRGGGATPFAFAEQGRAIVAIGTRHGGGMLLRVDVASGEVRELTPVTKDVVMGTGTPDGRFWAVTMGDPRTPGDLVLVDATTGSCRTLHAPNAAVLSEIAASPVEEFWYTSFDGKRIHGWLVKPPNFDPARKWPLILQIHGGPHAAYGVGCYHEFHVLAGAGYVVLYTNPRGSTSYGEEFADCIQYRYPGDDAHDLTAAVDEVVKQGWVDEKRIGVTGGSGGGLLTNWLIAKTDRFAAAVTQRCVTDWGSMSYSSDFTLFTQSWFRKPAYEDPEEYRARSPIAFVQNIHTPLMILHSEEDWRCPIGQAETMYRALKQQRKTVVMVRFPGEGHELSRSGSPFHRVQRAEIILHWFDTHLK